VAQLKPFVVTSWFGHRDDQVIPDAVRTVWAEKFQRGREQRATRQSNVDIALLDPTGKLVHWFDAVGSSRYGRPSDLIANTVKQIRIAASRIRVNNTSPPATPSSLLKLPDASPGKSGLRIFVRLDDRRMPAYRLPVVEFVHLSPGDWQALAWPEKRRVIRASKLQKWLSQVYPPGVMERVDRTTKRAFSINSVSGSLSLVPSTSYQDSRYAVASGQVELGDSGGDGFTFKGELELVLTYAMDAPEVQTLRGVFRGIYPRFDRVQRTSRLIPLEAVFESRPR